MTSTYTHDINIDASFSVHNTTDKPFCDFHSRGFSNTWEREREREKSFIDGPRERNQRKEAAPDFYRMSHCVYPDLITKSTWNGSITLKHPTNVRTRHTRLHFVRVNSNRFRKYARVRTYTHACLGDAHHDISKISLSLSLKKGSCRFITIVVHIYWST